MVFIMKKKYTKPEIIEIGKLDLDLLSSGDLSGEALPT